MYHFPDANGLFDLLIKVQYGSSYNKINSGMSGKGIIGRYRRHCLHKTCYISREMAVYLLQTRNTVPTPIERRCVG